MNIVLDSIGFTLRVLKTRYLGSETKFEISGLMYFIFVRRLLNYTFAGSHNFGFNMARNGENLNVSSGKSMWIV
jgi:hypothetical protein